MERRLFIERIGMAGLVIPLMPSYLFGKECSTNCISLGVVGTGQRGRQLATLVAQLPGVEVHYLCDPNAAALSQAEQALPAGTAYQPRLITDYTQLLDDAALDAVVVATPSSLLYNISRQACEAGKYVYAETAGPDDPETAHLLQATNNQFKRQMQLGWQRRAAPTLIQAARDVRRGLIGAVQQITITHTYDPAYTTRAQLHQMAQQDIDLSGFVAQQAISAEKDILPGSLLSENLGSSSTQFRFGEVDVSWQGLARYGGQAREATRTIRLFGSKGVLQTAADGLSYQIVSYTGRKLRKRTSDPLSDEGLTRLHLLHFLQQVRA